MLREGDVAAMPVTALLMFVGSGSAEGDPPAFGDAVKLVGEGRSVEDVLARLAEALGVTVVGIAP